MNRLMVFLFKIVFITSSSFIFLSFNQSNDNFDSYRLTLVDNRWPHKPFLVDLPKSNVEGMKSLESYISNGIFEDRNGNPEIGIVMGHVERTSSTQEHAWKFNLNSNSIAFSDVAMELCDGDFQFVENNLPYWLEKVKVFCPWGTKEKLQKIEKTMHNDVVETVWERKQDK